MNHTVSFGERLRRLVVPVKLPPPVNPALIRQAERRAESRQNRVSDQITGFAGSMTFVYLHIAWFGCWIGFGVEKYPFGLLTMIVSLEAIFLSTFVMIGQNRQADFAQRKADHDFNAQELELKLNTEVTKAVHALAKEIHATRETTAPGVIQRSDGGRTLGVM